MAGRMARRVERTRHHQPGEPFFCSFAPRLGSAAFFCSRWFGQAEKKWGFEAEGAAERAEDAAEARIAGDEGLHVGIGEEVAELAGGAGRFGDGIKNPGAAARQVGRALAGFLLVSAPAPAQAGL